MQAPELELAYRLRKATEELELILQEAMDDRRNDLVARLTKYPIFTQLHLAYQELRQAAADEG